MMNKRLQKPNIQNGDGDVFSLSEEARLHALLQSAYPAPPEHLCGDVMAKIGTMARKRKIRRTILKWGSAAACFVILCALAIVAGPLFRKDLTAASIANFAMSDDSVIPEYGTEAAFLDAKEGAAENDTGATDNTPKEALLYSATAEAEETMPDAFADDTAEAEIPYHTVRTSSNPTADEEKTVSEHDDADVLMKSKCVVKNTADPAAVAQNQVKWKLISYIAPEQYAQWMREHGYQTAADFTLAELISGMQIPLETFQTIVAMLGLEQTIDQKLYFPAYSAPSSAVSNSWQSLSEDRTNTETAAIRDNVQ